MQDVADRAKVSIATVSFVVNGTKQVGPATRQRVETAMAELGFTRNVLARALATRRSRIIALLYPALSERLNPTALEFVHAAASAVTLRDYHLVVWPVANDPTALRAYLEGGLVDGVLAMEVQLEDPRIAVLEAAEMPFVLIGRTDQPDRYPFADIDFESTMRAALDRLLALGHRRIALLVERQDLLGDSAYGPPVRGERAYREVTEAHGLPQLVLHGARTPDSGREAASELMRSEMRPTAVIVMIGEAASGLVQGLQRAGLEVPGDVSVVGLAMSALSAAYSDPPLDYYAAPGAELGRAAANALVDHLEGSESATLHSLVACVPVDGGTIGPVASPA